MMEEELLLSLFKQPHLEVQTTILKKNVIIFSSSNLMSFASIFKSLQNCSQTRNIVAAKILHADLFKKGLLFVSPIIQTKLIFTYATCLDTNTALQILTNYFKSLNPQNPLPFNLIISDFAKNGYAFFALKTFSFMHFNAISLDTYALCSSITASSSLRNFEFGKQIHSHVAKSGWVSSVFVGSALVDLYAKSSLIDNAAMVFNEIPFKNSVCANALLSGFCEARLWVEGLILVRKMPGLNLDYDHFTLSAILRACAGLSDIELGRQVHGYLIRKVYNFAEDVFLQSSLIEMYGKCGMVMKAYQVFRLEGLRLGCEKRRRDVVLWTSMLGVYGKNGHFEGVILLFKEMLKEGIKPDEVAFVTVISACGHTGQIRLGLEYFDCMTPIYNLIPGPEHYSCVVDLLCRAGELEKAMKLVNEMLRKGHNNGSISLWVALLSACSDHENVELGKFAARKGLELDPRNVGIYVKLSNLYAKLGMWDEIGQLREMMQKRGLKKDIAFSWIEVCS